MNVFEKQKLQHTALLVYVWYRNMHVDWLMNDDVYWKGIERVIQYGQ